MYVVLVYDISLEDNGQKVWRSTFKLCKKYLYHVQKSVFEGEISLSQLMELKLELNRIIREDKDSIIIFKSRQEKWLDKEFLGVQDDQTSNFI